MCVAVSSIYLRFTPASLLSSPFHKMSAYPAYVMGVLCITGGISGFVRRGSIPSMVAGVGVGLIYLWSADTIRRGATGGLEGALVASALLLISSLPRVTKGPVPMILSVTSASTALYYGSIFRD